MFDRIILKVSSVILCVISTAIATPSQEAFVGGVKNAGWMPGVCSVASLGQLIQQRDPNITPAEIVVRSGICTQTAYLSKALVDHPRFLDMGEPADVARLFGLGYSVAWKKYSGRPYGISKQAESLTIFKTTDEAVNWLKELITADTPVQVHVDTAYLANYGGVHGSHYVVVYGYDGNNVYYCENGGPAGTNENLALSWDVFKTAWMECYMLWLKNDPIRLDNDWILAWLARDIQATNKSSKPTGPYAIRAAAIAIRNGANGDTVFNDWMRSLYGNWRPYMVDFLNEAGHPDLAGTFDQACQKWKTILDMPLSNPDWNTICNLMEQAADIEQQVLTEMSALLNSPEPICLFTPTATENLSTFENCIFRWAQMPNVSRTSVQLAMTEDFLDKRSIGIFRPKKNKWFVPMTKKDWLKVLKKDDGDRQLLWQVFGPAKETPNISAQWMLTWDIQQMVSTSPVDNYAFASDELVTFMFEPPYVAYKPHVVISTTGDFNDTTTRIVLKPGRDQAFVSFNTSTLYYLKKKDDGDNIVYWRVEDAATKISTVVPSEIRPLPLP